MHFIRTRGATAPVNTRAYPRTCSFIFSSAFRSGSDMTGAAAFLFALAASTVSPLIPAQAQTVHSNPAPSTPSHSVQQPVAIRSGTVRSSDSRSPLAGARIVTAGRRVLTDSLGRFRIGIAGDSTAVRIERLGYTPRTLVASDLKGDILLTPAPTTLATLNISSEAPPELGRGSALGAATVHSDELHERGGTSLAERLSGTEGVSVQRMGEWGSRTLLRGLGGERLTVMVDGARVNRACTFGMDQGLATIDPSLVEKVEVLSGPGSTLYGSGNVGGVINVVTRRDKLPEGWSGEIRAATASAMSGGTAGGTLALRAGRADALISVDGSDFGDYRAPTGRVNGSGYRDYSANFTAGISPTAAQRATIQAQLYEGRDIGWPAMSGGTIPRESRYSISADHAIQVSGRLVDAISARAYVQRLDHHMIMDMRMPMTMPNGMQGTMQSITDARSHSTTSGGRGLIRLVPSPRTHLDVGIDATQWAAEATRWTETKRVSPMPGAPSTTELRTWPAVRVVDAGTFAQGEWMATDMLTVSAGVRGDFLDRRADGRRTTSDFVGTGNIGLKAQLVHGLATRIAVGRGYRVPDPTELYGLALRPDGFIYRGTPDLKAETNLNAEASLGWTHVTSVGAVDFGVTAFSNTLDNLIEARLAAGDTVSGRPVRAYMNVASARMSGVTARADIDLTRALHLRSSLSNVRGVDRTANAALAAVPPLEGSVALRAGGTRWIETEWQGAATQNRFAASAGEIRAPGYGVVHIRAGAALGKLGMNIGVENLLDKAYRAHIDPKGLLRTGRNAYLRVTHTF